MLPIKSPVCSFANTSGSFFFSSSRNSLPPTKAPYTELEELRKQLADRDKDLEKLKSENKSGELAKQLEELNAKYKTDTENLTAKLAVQRRTPCREPP